MLHGACTEYCNVIHETSKRNEGALPMITCNLGKTHSSRYPKNIFPEVFRIRLSFLHLYQIDYMKLSTRSDRLWLFYKVL